MADIKIYTSPTCPFCERTKDLLQSKKIEYKEVDVDKNIEERLKLLQEHNWMSTPAVFVDNELIGGYEDLVIFLNKGGKK